MTVVGCAGISSQSLGQTQSNPSMEPLITAPLIQSVTVNFTHEGVQSCAGSTCHGRIGATGITVNQNEIEVWKGDTTIAGAHSRSYKSLSTKRGRAIAERLGIENAKMAQECLSCHTDNVPRSQRGIGFDITEGIGCESCHGGSALWGSRHSKGNSSHSSLVSQGLVALENPNVSAQLCLSCHVGDAEDKRLVTHRYLAAGHPRLSFELDLFQSLQSHYSIDEDYLQRKKIVPGVQTWAIGQAYSLKEQLNLYADGSLRWDGVFPEPVFFDCVSCHRPISDDVNWQPKEQYRSGQKTSGQLKFNDTHMKIVLAISEYINPQLGKQIEFDIQEFITALNSNRGAISSKVSALNNSTDKLIAEINRTEFSRNQTIGILNKIMSETQSYENYLTAEQVVMAIDTLVNSMTTRNQISEDDLESFFAPIDLAYEAVESVNAYNPRNFERILGDLKVQVTQLDR